MSIKLGVVCRRLPSCWQTTPANVKIFSYSDGSCRVTVPIMESQCDQLLDWLGADITRLVNFSFDHFLREEAWQNPLECWVGAIITAETSVELSPSNPFDPVLPSPCLGLVPEGQPLRVQSVPNGHCVAAQHEQIFSSRLAEILAALAPCRLGEVRIGEMALQTYWRLHPTQSRRVLSLDGTRQVNCVACTSRIVANPGVWLGYGTDDLTLCRNEDGVGHLAKQHPCILSASAAQHLETILGIGYGLVPIFDVNSQLGLRVLDLLGRLLQMQAHKGQR